MYVTRRVSLFSDQPRASIWIACAVLLTVVGVHVEVVDEALVASGCCGYWRCWRAARMNFKKWPRPAVNAALVKMRIRPTTRHAPRSRHAPQDRRPRRQPAQGLVQRQTRERAADARARRRHLRPPAHRRPAALQPGRRQRPARTHETPEAGDPRRR